MTITRDEIAQALGPHHHSYDSDCDADFGCTCSAIDDYDESEVSHAEHLADELMPLIRRAQAEAWSEAYMSGRLDERTHIEVFDADPHHVPNRQNPYIEKEEA